MSVVRFDVSVSECIWFVFGSVGNDDINSGDAWLDNTTDDTATGVTATGTWLDSTATGDDNDDVDAIDDDDDDNGNGDDANDDSDVDEDDDDDDDIGARRIGSSVSWSDDGNVSVGDDIEETAYGIRHDGTVGDDDVDEAIDDGDDDDDDDDDGDGEDDNDDDDEDDDIVYGERDVVVDKYDVNSVGDGYCA